MKAGVNVVGLPTKVMFVLDTTLRGEFVVTLFVRTARDGLISGYDGKIYPTVAIRIMSSAGNGHVLTTYVRPVFLRVLNVVCSGIVTRPSPVVMIDKEFTLGGTAT